MAEKDPVCVYGTDLEELRSGDTLPSAYFKSEVVVTSTSANFNTATPTDVNGMTFTITEDGDYVVHGAVNCDAENDIILMYLAVDTGGGAVTDTDSEVSHQGAGKKAEQMTIQITYPLDGLVIGDVVTLQIDTDGNDIDLQTRRMLIQKWTA